MDKIRVAVLIFDDVDLMDITGPVEVFNAVRIPVETEELDPILRIYSSESKFLTQYVTLDACNFITSADGTKIIPDLVFSDIEDLSSFTIWVIPGGKGAQIVRKNKEYISKIEEAIDKSFITLSVCTGAYIVAETGFIDNDIVTTHWRHLDLFQDQYPHIKLANNARYCSGNKVITAGGVTAGIDGALHIISQIISENAAQNAADIINYTWLG